jgi:hypothetical protein
MFVGNTNLCAGLEEEDNKHYHIGERVESSEPMGFVNDSNWRKVQAKHVIVHSVIYATHLRRSPRLPS